jgi:hypothetical protein
MLMMKLSGEDRWRNRYAERLGGFEIDALSKPGSPVLDAQDRAFTEGGSDERTPGDASAALAHAATRATQSGRLSRTS